MGLCYVLYSDVDIHQITEWLPQCNWLLVIAFLLCNVGAMLLRGIRWRLQLRAIGVSPGGWTMSRSIFGTYAVNLVFPRLGELWRTAFIARTQSAPFSAVFGTMVGDRLADTLSVFLIAFATFCGASNQMQTFLGNTNLGPRISATLTSWPMLVTLLALAVAIVVIMRVKRVRNFVHKIWNGFVVLFTMPHRLEWLLLTMCIWGCYVLSMYLSLLAFPPTDALVAAHGLGCVMLTFVFGSLAMAIPSNGGIGPWQLAILFSLNGLYGMPRATALAFATLNLGATTILIIALGLVTFITLATPSKAAKK